MVTAIPVLLLTHDDFLWQHWHTLNSAQWVLTRGRDAADLRRWCRQDPAIAVIDVGVPWLPNWQTQASWQPLFEGVRVVIASVRPSDEEGVRAMTAGALGYCHAYAPAATLTHVLDAVSAGSVWMGASLVNRLLRQVHTHMPTPDHWHHPHLTERECAIALHVARGESNSKIAHASGISERTVKAHLTSIFDKLNIEDRLQLALLVHGIQKSPESSV